MNLTRFMSISIAALIVLMPVQSNAQRKLDVLEEELNLLKETIEANNRQLRKLKEKLKRVEEGSSNYQRAIQDIRKRLKRIDVLNRELQDLEARINEGTTGKKDAANLGLHAEVRIRPEFTKNRTDLNSDTDDTDGFWGHRVRLGADFGMDSWVRARIQIQEARTMGGTLGSSGAPGLQSQWASLVSKGGSLGVHEAWLELAPEMLKGFTLRAGRMEMSYGNERLIGRNDFSLTGQAFDGVVARYEHMPAISIDVFYTKLRESGTTDGDRDFMGLYATTQSIPLVTLDIYTLYLSDTATRSVPVDGVQTARKFESAILTAGARLEALFFDQLFLEIEAAYQFGDRTEPIAGERELSHFAAAYYAELSYQIPIKSRPSIGAFFVQASGDQNALDGKSVGFIPLFPTRHSFLGTMDLFSWTNIRDFGGKVEFTLPWDFGIFSAFHYLQLATDKGSALPGFGTGKTPDPTTVIGRNIGWEVDAAISWAPNDQLQMQAGYSYFNPGTVTRELSVCGKDKDENCDAAQWAYFQTRVRF